MDHLQPDQSSPPQYSPDHGVEHFSNTGAFPYDDANPPHRHPPGQYAPYSGTFPQPLTINNPQQPPRQPQSDHGFSSLRGLEFLEIPGPGVLYLSSLPGDADGDTDVNMVSVPSFRQGGSAGAGLDLGLGFGIAVDDQHDWRDGQEYGLLGRYFFGGNT
jgi:hypothetical protein